MKAKMCVFIALFLTFTTILFPGSAGETEPEAIETARNLVSLGEFSKAAQLLSRAISSAPEEEKKALEGEKERIRRIPLDYNKTEADILKQCQRRIKNFKPEELKKWEAEGKFDVRLFDGEKRYLSVSVSNLAKRYPEIQKRFFSYTE